MVETPYEAQVTPASPTAGRRDAAQLVTKSK